MNMDRELERLAAVYAESDDEELLLMYERREDLTDVAQAALARVMKERGVVPVEAEAVEEAAPEVDAGELKPGEAGLWLFEDMFNAKTAAEVLTSAGIEHRMVDRSDQRSSDGLRGRYVPALLLVLDAADRLKAEAVLRQRLGMFPLAEVDGAREGVEGDAEDFAVLTMLERTDALAAAHALGEAGISFRWRDGRDAAEGQPDEETVTIEVKVGDVERAAGLVEG